MWKKKRRSRWISLTTNITPDEAIAAFRQLSNEEQRNLVASARACLAGSGFATPNELISEAYVRIAEGRRKWRTSKTFIQFLKGVVRSLASDGDFLPEEKARAPE